MDITIKNVDARKAAILTQALFNYSIKCSENSLSWNTSEYPYTYWRNLCVDAQNLALDIGRSTKELFDN